MRAVCQAWVSTRALALALTLAVSVTIGDGASASTTPSGEALVREHLSRSEYYEAVHAARQLLATSTSVDETSLAAAQALDLLVETLIAADFRETDEARELAARSLGIKERELGRDDPGYAWTLALSAVVGPFASRASSFERALEIHERSDPDSLEVAWIRFHLGWVHFMRNERARGIAEFQRAFEIRERELGPLHPATIDALRDSVRDGDPRCIEKLTRALEALEREGRADRLEAAALHESLCNCTVSKLSASECHERNTRALEIKRQFFAEDSIGVAAVRLGLAFTHTERGELRAAHAQLALAQAAYEKTFGRGHPATLPVVAVQARIGGYADMEELIDRALKLREAQYGDHAPAYFELGIAKAWLLKGRGDYPQARTVLERELARVERFPESIDHAGCLHGLGDIAARMGDLVEARSLLERSLAVWEKHSPVTHWVLLLDLGDVHTRLGDTSVAEQYLHRALASLEAESGPRHMGVGTAMWLLGKNYMASGEWVRARDALERALETYEGVFGVDASPWSELCLRELCTVHAALGQLEPALDACERSRRMLRTAVGQVHPHFADVEARSATVLWARGVSADALSRAIAAEEASRNFFLKTARQLSEREALDLDRIVPAGLDVALSIVASGPGHHGANAASRVWDQVTRSRAIVLDEVALRHEVSVGADAAARAAAGRLESARDALSRLTLRPVEADQDPAQIEKSYAEVELAERELAATDAVFKRSLARRRISLPEVQHALPARVALVSYVKYRRLTSFQPPSSVPSYLAFVRPSGRTVPSVVDLGPAERIDRMVADWRRELTSPPHPSEVAARHRTYREVGSALREVVWDPIAARVGGDELILVVPDGSLQLVNFMALPYRSGRYVVDDAPVVQLLSAERDIVTLSRDAPAGSGLLAVGAPAFDLEPAVVEDRDRQTLSALWALADTAVPYRGTTELCGIPSLFLEPLPHARAEVEQVASIWSEAERGPVVKLVEEQASESAFKRLVRGRRVIHVATHAFVGEDDCGQGPNVAALTFAGASHREAAGPNQEDGILTAEEISSLDLTRAEWVVLSACESGIGANIDGEGVFGLRRAFQTAGARTLLMSLWRVQDDAASQWMVRLYQARAAGASTAAAVREAASEVLNARRQRGMDTHPYYWGAFVAAGDWR